jgi:hypothetical protein
MSSIALKGCKCVAGFDKLLQALRAQSRTISTDDLPDHLAVSEKLDWFKLWAGNIGALQDPRRSASLGYRLRESPEIEAHVVELLEDLLEALEDRMSYVGLAIKGRRG